jgi:hypothetical protein
MLLLGRLCAYGAPAAAADPFTVNFEIVPGASQLFPGSPASLILSVLGAEPLSAGRVVRVRLDAPAPGAFFSTDYPAVEGTRLLEISLPLISAKAQWRQTFPIRGDYRLTVSFPEAAADTAPRTFPFQVRENPRKWVAAGALAIALFLLGIIAGRVFSARPDISVMSLASVSLLLALFAGTSPERVSARDEPPAPSPAALDVEPATVGKPARIHWRLHLRGAEEKTSGKLSLSIDHLEKGSTVFAIENIPVADEFAFAYQFTDGSDYRLEAVGSTQTGATARAERIISVTPVAPPFSKKLSSIGFFLAAVLFGLVTGRWLKRRSPRLRISGS